MNTLISKNKLLADYLLIIFGTTLMAVAINVFYDPYDLVTGGVTGIAIILRDYTEKLGRPIPIWVTNIVLNVPLFLAGIKVNGRSFLQKSLFATVYFSFALFYTGHIPPIQSDLTLTAVFGGVLTGAGLGLVFRAASTTGGTDLAASIIHSFFKHISVSKILFVLDSVVIAIGFFVFGPTNAMYAIIAVFIATQVIDSILEGLSFAKAAFIISDQSEDIAEALMKETDRGATALHGKGMYTKQDKNVLLCVVSNKEVIKVKEIVRRMDLNAFVIVADVREVLGLGFKES